MAFLLSRRLCRSLISNPRTPCYNIFSKHFETVSNSGNLHDADSRSDSPPSSDQRIFTERPLENGLDAGIYKAIIVGQVGQSPIQKKLKSGKTVTLLSIGTGGIRNNRRPLDNEEPIDYANRCSVQWHRVSIYPERLGDVAMKNVTPGTILYLEGNLETKVFSDPVSGLVRRIREIAVRGNGRIVFLGKGSNGEQATQDELRNVGYQ